MKTRRAAHTATLLKNGHVLVCGGFASSTLSSAEIYDPKSKIFKPVENMSIPRSGHTATLLPDGKVLIAGRL
ncbi:MAG: kelch repeat-containing protein [Chitinophagaceae bacterium]